MYLSNAQSLEEIIQYGIKPLTEMIYMFEDLFLTKLDNRDFQEDSAEYILWQEIKAKVLLLKDSTEKI